MSIVMQHMQQEKHCARHNAELVVRGQPGPVFSLVYCSFQSGLAVTLQSQVHLQ